MTASLNAQPGRVPRHASLRTPRWLALGVLWSVALLALASPVAAATPWQITASPTALVLGQPTQIILTITGGENEIATLDVVAPSGFQIAAAAVITPPQGMAWQAVVVSPAEAMFHTNADPQRIKTGVVTQWAVTVVATSYNPPAWAVSAYEEWPLPANSSGPPASGLPPFQVPPPTPPPATPTPTPTPAAGSTPGPTAATTATATATATAATTATATATAATTATATATAATTATATATAAPSSTWTPTPEAAVPWLSPSPWASPAPGTSPSPTPGSSAEAGILLPTPSGSPQPAFGGAGAGVVVPRLPAGAGVTISGLSGFASATLYAWLVPGFFVALPGLLILLVVVGQVVAGGIIVPLIGRWLGDDKSRRLRKRRGARATAGS